MNKMIGILVLVLFLLPGCSLQAAKHVTPASTPVQTDHQQQKIEKPVHTKATFAAVGDILIHDSVYKDAADRGKGKYDFRPMFDLVRPYLEKPDITMANAETMIGGVELGLSGYPQFNSPVEIGDALKDAGIDIVTISNNHSLDRGEKGIDHATQHWDELQIPYVGAYRSPDDKMTLRKIEKNGIVFSFLSYTYGTNGIPIPTGKGYLVNLIDPEQIKKDIQTAKTSSDVVVLALHMGTEYLRMPNEEQTTLFKEFAEQGADIIVGTHPHVLEPVQWIDRKDGKRTYVMYSLGNFLSAQDELYRLIGGVSEIEVDKTTTGTSSTVELSHPSFLPVFTYYKNWRNYQLIPLSQVTDDQLPHAKQYYTGIKQHMSQWVPELSFSQQ